VYITNPGARALEENVYANCGKDGLWWFWWSWAERISLVDDVDTAATVIVRVLSLPRSALSAGHFAALGQLLVGLNPAR
jgi:hypothetical protein